MQTENERACATIRKAGTNPPGRLGAASGGLKALQGPEPSPAGHGSTFTTSCPRSKCAARCLSASGSALRTALQIDFIIKAVSFVATHGWRFLPLYTVGQRERASAVCTSSGLTVRADFGSGVWKHRSQGHGIKTARLHELLFFSQDTGDITVGERAAMCSEPGTEWATPQTDRTRDGASNVPTVGPGVALSHQGAG